MSTRDEIRAAREAWRLATTGAKAAPPPAATAAAPAAPPGAVPASTPISAPPGPPPAPIAPPAPQTPPPVTPVAPFFGIAGKPEEPIRGVRLGAAGEPLVVVMGEERARAEAEAAKEFQEKAARRTEFNKRFAEALAENLRRKGKDVAVPILTKPSGETVIDVQKYEDDSYTYFLDEEAKKRGFKDSTGLTDPKVRGEVVQAATIATRRELERMLNAGRGLTFVDTDPGRTNRFLAGLPPVVGALGAVVMPRATMTTSPRGKEFEVERGGEAAFRLLNIYPAFVGAVERVEEKRAAEPAEMVPSLGHYIARTLAETQATEEARLEFIKGVREDRTGAETFGESLRKAAEAADAPKVAQDRAYRAGFVFGLVTTDIGGPDPVGAAMALGGKATRLASRGATNAEKLSKLALEASQAPTAESAFHMIAAENPAVAERLKAQYAQQYRVPQSVVDWSNRFEEQAVKQRERASKLREELVGLVDEAEIARRAPELRAAELAAAEAELEAAGARAAATEAARKSWGKDGDGTLLRMLEQQGRKADAAQREVDEVGRLHEVLEAENSAELKEIDDARRGWERAVGERQAAKDVYEEVSAKRKVLVENGQTELNRAFDANIGIERASAEAARDIEELVSKAARTPTEEARLTELRDRVMALADERIAGEQKVTSLRDRLRRTKSKSHSTAVRVVEARKLLDESIARSNKVNADFRATAERLKPTWDQSETLRKRMEAAVRSRTEARAVVAAAGLDPAVDGPKLRAHMLRLETDGLDATGALKDARGKYAGASRAARRAEREAVDTIAAVERKHGQYVDTQYRTQETELRARGWQDVFRSFSEDIKRGAEAIKKLAPPGPMFEDVLAPATLGVAKRTTPPVGAPPGTPVEVLEQDRVIDPRLLREYLEKTYGAGAVQRVIERSEPRGTGELLGRLVASREEATTLGAHAVARLQEDLPDLLRKAAEEAHPNAEAIALVRAIEIASQRPEFMAKGIRESLEAQFRGIVNSFDYVRTNIGAVSEEVADVLKAFENQAARYEQEVYSMLRRVRPDDITDETAELVQAHWGIGRDDPRFMSVAPLVQYLDTRAALPVRGLEIGTYPGLRVGPADATWFNTSRPETGWRTARRYVLADPRTAKFVKAQEEWAGRGGVGAEPTSNTLPHDSRAPQFEALARMWIKSGVPTPPGLAADFYGAALKYMGESESFSAFSRKMRGYVRARMAGSESGLTRALGYGALGVVHAAMLDDANRAIAKAAGGLIPVETAEDVNRLLTGAWDKIEDLAEAEKVAVRLGLPEFTGTLRREVTPGMDPREAVRLIQTGAAGDGRTFFQTTVLMDRFNEALPKVVKELDARHAKAENVMVHKALDGWRGLASAWKTSVVTGLLVPNPKYWWNNIMGDFSQMWMELGVTAATAQTLQNLPVNIPFLGRIFQDYTSSLARKAGKPALGTAFNAILNPHIANIWRPSVKGLMVTRTGQVIPYDDLRRWLVEDGILATFVREEVIEAFERVTSPGLKRAVKNWSEGIADFGDFVQQRQRTGLYTALLQAGHTRKEAKRLTLDALYDWKHGVAQWEARSLMRVFPFYRFWRLALRQVTRALVDPLVKADVGQAALGRTAMKQVRGQLAAFEGLPEFVNPSQAEGYLEDQTEYDALARYARPGWARRRPLWEVGENKEQWVLHYQANRGRVLSHNMMVLPPPTALDSASIIMSMMEGMVGGAFELTGGKAGPIRLAPDWEERLWEPALEFVFPFQRELIQQWAATVGVDAGGVYKRNTTRLSEAEATGLFGRPMYPVEVWRDPETGAWQTNALGAFAWRQIPVWGTQLPRIMDSAYYDNPEMQAWAKGGGKGAPPGELAQGLWWFFRDWGLGVRHYPYDPYAEVQYWQRKIREEMGQVPKEAAREAGPPTEIVPPPPATP